MGVNKAEGCPVSAPEMNPKNPSKCSQGLLDTAEDSSHNECSCQSAWNWTYSRPWRERKGCSMFLDVRI